MLSLLSDDWQVSLPGPYPSTPAHLHQCQLPSLLPPSVQLLCRALKETQKLVSVDTDLETHTMAPEIWSCGLRDINDTKCITCKCNQVGEAKTIGKNNELHCVQVGPRTEPPRIQVFQHSPHTADSCVGKQHLKGTHASSTENKIKESHVIIKTRICFSSASVFQGC